MNANRYTTTGSAIRDSNLYRYVGNNAATETDPSGLEVVSTILDGSRRRRREHRPNRIFNDPYFPYDKKFRIICDCDRVNSKNDQRIRAWVQFGETIAKTCSDSCKKRHKTWARTYWIERVYGSPTGFNPALRRMSTAQCHDRSKLQFRLKDYVPHERFNPKFRLSLKESDLKDFFSGSCDGPFVQWLRNQNKLPPKEPKKRVGSVYYLYDENLDVFGMTAGHAAVLIGSPEQGWQYYSLSTGDPSWNSWLTGTDNLDSRRFSSLEEAKRVLSRFQKYLRWNVELDLRCIKDTLNLGHLRCKSACSPDHIECSSTSKASTNLPLRRTDCYRLEHPVAGRKFYPLKINAFHGAQ